MKKYNYENKTSFLIDEDGDSFDSFQKSLLFIQLEIKPDDYQFKSPFWNGSNGYFIKDGIKVLLEYSNWTGTVLRVDEHLSKEKLEKVCQWAEDIYKVVHT